MARGKKEKDLQAQLQAIYLHYAMEETKDYLERGRRFADIEDGKLTQRWAEAFRRWAKHRSDDNQREVDDLIAELRLRGTAEPPYDMVQPELDAMRAEIESDPGPATENAMTKIREFLRARNKPMN